MQAAGRLAFLLFLAAVLGYGASLAYYTLISFDVVNLRRDVFFDDAFYYFEIAKNLAAGKFSTFDGGITRTNGYHPVWLLLVTPFYWVLDLESALFGIHALEIMLIAGSVCLVALAVRLAQLPWILLVAVLPALYGQKGMTGGMEAAAGAFFLGATLLAAVLFVRDARRWRWLLAGIAFLLPWVRLEYVAIALFVTGGLGLLARCGPLRDSPLLPSPGPIRLPTGSLPFVAAIAGIVAYFLYNGLIFGGVVPVSGAAKIDLSARQGMAAAIDWSRVIRAAEPDAVVVAELCGYVLLVWAVCRLRGWRNDAVWFLAVLLTVLALGVENLAVKAQVALVYAPDIERYYSRWYYVPGYLVAALMVPVRCYLAIFLLRRLVAGRWMFWRRAAVVAVCAAGMVFALDAYKFTEPFRLVHEQRHGSSVFEDWGLAREFEWILPEEAVVGAWNAGAIAYFSELPVVNLDGVVNSYDYLRTDSDKWGLWRQGEGVPAFGVTHLVDVLSREEASTLEVAKLAYVGSSGGSLSLRLWSHGPSSVRSRPWRSMTSPSIGVDGGATGYRVIRHGRLMQVFVPECVPLGPTTNVPEMLVFGWQEGGATRRERRLWARPRRTEIGYCAMSFLLPHGAEAAAEISVDGATVDRVLAGAAPILRSRAGTSVHAVSGGRLLYVREPAEARDVGGAGSCVRRESRYFLHIHPASRRHLPPHRVEHGFAKYGGPLGAMYRRMGDRCVAEVQLPAFRIREAFTGELGKGERIWHARVDGLALRPAAVDDFLGGAVRIVDGEEWDVYHHEHERKLLYVRDGDANGVEKSAGCAAAPVFLHVHPRRAGDLPEWQQQPGFANFDFDLWEVGFVSAGRCFAAVPLPAYEVSHLVTGVPGASEYAWHAG